MNATPTSDAAPIGRRERKKREMRARIYDTARGLFLERGFETTTVEQIAETADIAPATFFNHFTNKHAVLAEMTGDVFDGLQAMIDEQLARPCSTRDRILGFAEEAATQIEQSRQMAHHVLLELVRATARHGQIAPYVDRAHAGFGAMIEQGQRAGDVRSDLDAAFLAEMVVGTINATLTNWINDPSYPLESRLRQSAAFIVEAIETAPRRSGS